MEYMKTALYCNAIIRFFLLNHFHFIILNSCNNVTFGKQRINLLLKLFSGYTFESLLEQMFCLKSFLKIWYSLNFVAIWDFNLLVVLLHSFQQIIVTINRAVSSSISIVQFLSFCSGQWGCSKVYGNSNLSKKLAPQAEIPFKGADN